MNLQKSDTGRQGRKDQATHSCRPLEGGLGKTEREAPFYQAAVC